MNINNDKFLEIARVKNGFIDNDPNIGYRDIKINFIFHSNILKEY